MLAGGKRKTRDLRINDKVFEKNQLIQKKCEDKTKEFLKLLMLKLFALITEKILYYSEAS